MKLRETLVAYMLPLLVLPVMAFGYLAYQFSKDYLQQQAYFQADKALTSQQLQLSDFLQQQQITSVLNGKMRISWPCSD